MSRWLRTYGTFIGFLLLVMIFAFLRPDVFLTLPNLRNITEQVALLAIVAATMTVVMAAGDFDLSVGALASLCGVIVADLLLRQFGVVASILITLVVGALAGAINGALVAYAGLSAFVATLSSMTMLRGLSHWYADGSTLFFAEPIAAFQAIGQGSSGPLPNSVLVMAAVMALIWLMLDYTMLGRRFYAVGGNAVAAYLAGINVTRLRLVAFVFTGLGAAVAGIVLTSRLASAHPTAGEPLMLNSIAAVFLGMTMFREGESHAPGTFFGVLILGVLNNGLNLLRVDSYIQNVLTGGIIILAVLVSGLARRN